MVMARKTDPGHEVDWREKLNNTTQQLGPKKRGARLSASEAKKREKSTVQKVKNQGEGVPGDLLRGELVATCPFPTDD